MVALIGNLDMIPKAVGIGIASGAMVTLGVYAVKAIVSLVMRIIRGA